MDAAASWSNAANPTPSVGAPSNTQSNVRSLVHSSDSHTRVRQGIPKRIELSDLIHSLMIADKGL